MPLKFVLFGQEVHKKLNLRKIRHIWSPKILNKYGRFSLGLLSKNDEHVLSMRSFKIWPKESISGQEVLENVFLWKIVLENLPIFVNVSLRTFVVRYPEIFAQKILENVVS